MMTPEFCIKKVNSVYFYFILTLTSTHVNHLVLLTAVCLSQIGPARFRAPELLFRPDLIGDESEGIHEVLAFAIQKSDMDLRRTLFSNIVLSGGSTLLKGKANISVKNFFQFSIQWENWKSVLLFLAGFGDRLLSEVKKLAPKDVKIKVTGTSKEF